MVNMHEITLSPDAFSFTMTRSFAVLNESELEQGDYILFLKEGSDQSNFVARIEGVDQIEGLKDGYGLITLSRLS